MKKKILKFALAAIVALLLVQAVLAAGTYQMIRKWGSTGAGDGQFNDPAGIAVDTLGYVYVTDLGNNRIQKFDSNGNFITKWGSYGPGSGQFNQPYEIAADTSGYVYVTDAGNTRIQKFDSNGNFITTWGSLGTGNGQFGLPYGIAVDTSGYVYVTDDNNNRIQKFDSNGNFITAWASWGTGNGQFKFPTGIAMDVSGNLYVSDIGNYRIQKFDSDGNFITTWGSYGTGDGQFWAVIGVAVDAWGNVYVTDVGNNRIQKFDSNGNFITAWGSSGTGDGQFDRPWEIAVSTSGNIYVTDTYNNRIQEFADTTPPVTTITPNGIIGDNGWYTSDVQISLTATDNDGSGVASTGYSFDGINWNTYTVPFTISTEGKTTVYYNSTDNAGNIEETKHQAISIDKTPPLITITSPMDGAEFGLNQKVTAAYSASDSVSDLASVTGSIPNGGTINTAGPGPYTFTVTATDKAGNTAGKTNNYVVYIPVKVTIVPKILNLAGKGAFVSVVNLPKGYPAADVDKSSIQCNGAAAKRVITSKLFPQFLIAIFKTSELNGVAPGDKVTLTVSGNLKGNLKFEGSNTVKVIRKIGISTDEILDWTTSKDTDLFTKYNGRG